MTFQKIYETVSEPFATRPMLTWFEQNEKKCFHQAEFQAFTDSCASYLENFFKDVPKGRWIGLKCKNHPMWYPVFFGLEKIGYPVLLLDENLDSKILESFCQQANLAGIVSDKAEQIQTVPCCQFQEISFSSGEKPLHECWEYRTAFCTSGTTGKAKIFVFYADTVAEQSIRARESFSKEEIFQHTEISSAWVLMALPQRHCLGFGLSMLVWLWGTPVILPEKEGIFSIADTCRKHHVWCLCNVPAIWKGLFRMAEARFGDSSSESMHKLLGDDLKLAVSAGARMDETLWNKLRKTDFTAWNGWGMTETGFVSLGNISTDDSIDYLGQLIGNHQTKLLKTELSEYGELAVNGKLVYDSMLIDGKEIPRNPEEYYHTGDLFAVENNRYYFKGRCKGVLIREDGENIYLDELESRFRFLENNAEQFCVFEHQNMPALVFFSQKPVTEDLISELRKVNYSLPQPKRIMKFYSVKAPLPMTSKGETARYYMSRYLTEHPELTEEITLYQSKTRRES